MAEGAASMQFSKNLRWQMSAEIMKQSKSQFYQFRLPGDLPKEGQFAVWILSNSEAQIQ